MSRQSSRRRRRPGAGAASPRTATHPWPARELATALGAERAIAHLQLDALMDRPAAHLFLMAQAVAGDGQRPRRGIGRK